MPEQNSNFPDGSIAKTEVHPVPAQTSESTSTVGQDQPGAVPGSAQVPVPSGLSATTRRP